MRDRVQQYFDGELEPAERARFEATMTGEDRERLAALAEMRALINATLDADAGEVDVWSGVAKQLAKERSHRGWRRSRLFGGGAASVLLAAAALVLFLRVQPEHNHCEVEDLEFHGAYASVIELDDKDDGTTLIWTEDEDEEEEN